MNIPTAEELYRDTKINPNLDLFSDDVKHLVELMIEFAKLHVEAALKDASENTLIETTLVNTPNNEVFYKHFHRMNKDSILNSYPLSNIK